MDKGLKGRLGLFLFVIGIASTTVHAEEVGRWGIGLRGGVGFLSQDVDQDAEGLTGPAVSLTTTYQIRHAASLGLVEDMANFLFLSSDSVPSTLAVGVDVAWASHKIKSKSDGFNFGVSDALVVLPHVEIRSGRFEEVTPYLLLGIGLSFDSFRESPEFAARCAPDPCNIERAQTLLFKVAGGADYFLTPRLALNTELGWKFSNRDVDPKINATPALSGLRTSGLTVLAGLRYYF